MRAFAIAIFLLLSVLAQPSFAQQKAGARTLVERGLNAYLKDGAKAAIQAWLTGSSLEGNTQAMTQANSLRQFEDFYGKPESFNIVRENVITPRSQMIVFSVNYAKGILFGRFQAYETKSGEWVATEFKFHTEAAAVLPPEIVFDLKTK